MSHFTVLVLRYPGQSLDDLLEHWNENREVPAYRAYEEGEAADHWLGKVLAEEGTPPVTWRDIAYHSAQRQLTDPDADDPSGRIYYDDDLGRAYTLTTYNPDSKWDWWTEGGRWDNELPRLDHTMTNSAAKADLDIEGKREMARVAAKAERDEVLARIRQAATDDAAAEAMIAGYRTFEEMREVHGIEGIDQARAEFWDQPAITAYKATLADDHARIGFSFSGGEMLDRLLGPSEAEVLDRAAAAAWPGWALLNGLQRVDGHAGVWLAPGRMGWFAANDATEGSTEAYLTLANKAIDDAPDDTLFTQIDCHI